MRIALINVTRPQPGTSDKVTEYTYQLYKHLSKIEGNRVDLVYAIGETKASNTIGLIYANTVFRSIIPKLAKKDYDIIHITNQEIGFAAKILRNSGWGGVIITTLHDTLRMRNDLHRGLKQKMYSNLTTLNIRNALEASDIIIFDDQKTKEEVNGLHDIKEAAVIPLGINAAILETPLRKRPVRKRFVVGYTGDSLLSNKNLMVIIKAADLMKGNKEYVFAIYGGGIEQENLNMYMISNNLDNVELRSPIPESKLVGIYDSFDAFVYPALGETYSMQILEAFGRGLPVVIDSRAKYIDDIKKHCLKAEGERDLINIIKRLKKSGWDKKASDSALRYARSLTWDRTAKETFDVYTKRLNKGKPINQ